MTELNFEQKLEAGLSDLADSIVVRPTPSHRLASNDEQAVTFGSVVKGGLGLRELAFAVSLAVVGGGIGIAALQSSNESDTTEFATDAVTVDETTQTSIEQQQPAQNPATGGLDIPDEEIGADITCSPGSIRRIMWLAKNTSDKQASDLYTAVKDNSQIEQSTFLDQDAMYEEYVEFFSDHEALHIHDQPTFPLSIELCDTKDDFSLVAWAYQYPSIESIHFMELPERRVAVDLNPQPRTMFVFLEDGLSPDAIDRAVNTLVALPSIEDAGVAMVGKPSESNPGVVRPFANPKRALRIQLEDIDRLDEARTQAEAVVGVELTAIPHQSNPNIPRQFEALFEQATADRVYLKAWKVSHYNNEIAISLSCGEALAVEHGDPCFQWLTENAETYGLYNNDPSQPWTWTDSDDNG